MVALLLGLRFRPGILLGSTASVIAIMLVIDRSIRRPEGRIGRVLSSPILVYLGTISYSLYL